MSSQHSPSTSIEIRVPTGSLATAVRTALKTMKPPPTWTVSNWADERRVLSPESSAEPGKWSTARQPYQRQIMDAMGDPTVPLVVLMTSSQVGKTETTINLCGFHIDQDPAPILVLQPTLEMAKAWSTDRLTPMLRDSPTFSGAVAEARTRDSGNKQLHKTFRGGHITMAGANSPASLASRPIRVLICDEVDRYPPSAGDEGDPISLAQKRTTTFFNRKTVLTSTPTLKGESRIERAFEQSDQRHYFVPCPHCGTMQRLEWGGKESPNGLKWKTDDKGQHFPESTVYVCVEGCIIEERAKPRMIGNGEWRASRPFAGIAGFHIWAAYSLHANSSWANLVREWLDAKGDPLSRQTFVNLVLGLPYEDRGTHALNEKTLAQRAEKWPAEVPFGVAVLTAGLDVQDDRVEIEVVGWGRNEERWSIEHEVVEGDPGGPALWAEVDAFLRRTWARDDGRPFAIHAACIDSGGHFTEAVYTFSKARLGRRIWAIKGEAARGGRRSPVWPVKRPSARNRQAFRPVIIGVNAAKDVIRSRLHLDPPRAGEPVAGYMHFPDDRDLGYFAQLVSERSVMKQAGGQRYRVWELGAGRTNEALDLAVYSYAALCGLLHFGLKLNQRADDMAAQHAAPPPQAPPGAPRPSALMQPAAAPAPVAERRSLLSRFA